MDNAITGAQCNATTGLYEVWQGVLGVDIDRLRIGGRVTKGLHHKICGEAEASEFFQFVSRHRARCILGTDCGHARFAVGPWSNTSNAAGFTDDLLGKGEAVIGRCARVRAFEGVRNAETQGFARALGQAATNDQWDTAASLYFIEQDVGGQFEFGYDFACFVVRDLACIRMNHNDITGFHLRHVTFNGQGA